MVKTGSSAKEMKFKTSKFGYIILFVFCIFLIGGFGYFFKKDALKHQQIQRQDHKSLLETLSKKEEELGQLRAHIYKLRNEELTQPESIKNSSYGKLEIKVSSDLQKIIMQQKIERRILNGKDFSIELHTLEALLKGTLDKPEFEILRRYAAEGIPTTYEIEKAIRRAPLETTDYSHKNWFLKLLSHFFIVSSREHKENFDMLIELIRTDRMQKSIELVEEHFSNRRGWKSMLEKRLEIKRALKKLENLIFESVRKA